MEKKYQICTRCIMDTTDPDIQFDKSGVCNHCTRYDNEKAKERLFIDKAGQQKFNELINKIKAIGKDKKYDCILGVSGGADSTFTAYLIKKLGLRPLAVHVDNGWNSELAVSNIEKFLKALDIDLYTYVIDWEEFKDLQLSFLKGSVPDAEIPTDHAISAILYKIAAKNKISFIFTGVNISTEGIHPIKWSYGLWDWKYIKSVHKKFGKLKLKSFPRFSIFALLYYVFIKRIKKVPILNYIKYVKQDAIKIMKKELSWQCYGGKHCESIYTRFFQSYILPKKFDIDKRRAHLSSLICSNQITREQALEEMNHNPYPTEQMMKSDKEYALKKLGFTEKEFKAIMSLPIKSARDYPSNYWLFPIARSISRKFKIIKFL